MALFVSGRTRIVYMGGRLGIHSCAAPDGTQAPQCNTAMAANATAHGVPWGVIESFGNYTKPSNMMWLVAEDAECWGLMKWSAEDNSNNGLACWVWANFMRDRIKPERERRKPEEVTAENATDILCRMNAGTSRIHVPTGKKEQGFSDAYRRACERIAADRRTPKYAAIDIIMWLALTDPEIEALKPATLMVNILGGDNDQIIMCWKCLTIGAMSYAVHGSPSEALKHFRLAAWMVKRDTGSVPKWLTSRVDIAAGVAAKRNH